MNTSRANAKPSPTNVTASAARKGLGPLMSAMLLVCGSAAARAAEVPWANSNGGSFHVGTNWTGGVVPGSGDSVLFSRTRNSGQLLSYTVSFGSSSTNVGLAVGADRVTLDMNGNAHLLSSPGTVMRIGTSSVASGLLTLTDGVVATTAPDASVFIGAAPNVAGFLSISTGAQLLGPAVYVGYDGPGALVLQNGGDLVGGPMVIGDTGVGTATVSGAGSAMVVEAISLGLFASGTLNIDSGGRLESTTGSVGSANNALGTVNIDGAGSRWTSSELVYIGDSGPGVLNITNGGRAQVSALTAGYSGPGTISISNAGELIVSADCSIGDVGLGTMSVLSGGLVQSARGSIGGDELVTVSIDGAGSRWISSGPISVSANGTSDSILNITGGGEVTSTSGELAPIHGVALVSVSGEGSRWTIAGDLAVGGTLLGGQRGGTGTVTIGPGGTVTADAVYIFRYGSVQLSGGALDAARIVRRDVAGRLLLDSGTLHAEVVEFGFSNEGVTLAPGHPGSAGRTTIEGDCTQLAAATMEIDIGGTTPGTQHDQVTVEDTAMLGGTLAVKLINGFVPSPGQTFVVLNAGTVVPGISITGSFANVANGQRLAITGGGGSFIVNYGPGSPFEPDQVVLSGFTTACRADFNGSGTVTVLDILDYLGAFFTADPRANFDGLGPIDTADIFAFLNAWFAGC